MLTQRMNAQTTGFRRLLAGLLTGTCCVLAAGLFATAAGRVDRPTDEPLVRFVETGWIGTEESASDDEVQLAAAHDVALDSPVKDAAPAEQGRKQMTTASAPAAGLGAMPASAQMQFEPSERRILMEVTAYCPCARCCGPNAQGITASGKPVSYNNGRFVAADTRLLPFGTQLSIPGYNGGEPVEVIDRGGAIKGNKLDVYFDSHQTALQWGRQQIWVTVVE
jgi:3D (Asp-Asp-Asp) domain-containing protein